MGSLSWVFVTLPSCSWCSVALSDTFLIVSVQFPGGFSNPVSGIIPLDLKMTRTLRVPALGIPDVPWAEQGESRTLCPGLNPAVSGFLSTLAVPAPWPAHCPTSGAPLLPAPGPCRQGGMEQGGMEQGGWDGVGRDGTGRVGWSWEDGMEQGGWDGSGGSDGAGRVKNYLQGWRLAVPIPSFPACLEWYEGLQHPGSPLSSPPPYLDPAVALWGLDQQGGG